jgi:hypothetical protein
MTAALAPYEDLIAFDHTLVESSVEGLSDESLVSFLLLRFRSFLRCGYAVSDALLLAVGYSETDARFIRESTEHASPVLH